MNFKFNKTAVQNLRKSLRLEWLDTNGLGDYASSSIVCCNTRKYHGLFVANLERPSGRHVLLSALEESLLAEGREFQISCRQHPGQFYPLGHEYMREAELGVCPRFRYHIGPLILTKEIMLVQTEHRVMIRYSVRGPQDAPAMKLRLKPLLAYRNFHDLTKSNLDLRVKTFPAVEGFKIQPYDGMPPLFMQIAGGCCFFPAPDWYYNVEYMMERERGFSYTEDLFQPGVFESSISPQKAVLLSASLAPSNQPEDLVRDWEREMNRRLEEALEAQNIEGHLAQEGQRFLITTPQGHRAVLAGYHWFDAWGRDTMIALPGLTFCAGRKREGVEILRQAAQALRNGLIPNCYGNDGASHAYNSADASLWYVWAVQMMERSMEAGPNLVKEFCWEPLKEIVSSYARGQAPGVAMDEGGLLSVGDESTQLTWMDAAVGGRPVTPRHGCPVEINALWYNALAYVNALSARYGEEPLWSHARLAGVKTEFLKRFWSEENGYLADVWRPEGADWSFRPNQLFAASLPEPLLDRHKAAAMTENVRRRLLTPYGLRTLSPDNPAYCSVYEGGPEQRDSRYHQGTVWPWLLGAFCDALFYAAWDKEHAARQLLTRIRPLCSDQMRQFGIGSIGEIFDAAPPYQPRGCIAQAWSTAEVLRMLKTVRSQALQVYLEWEASLREEVQ